MNSGPKTLLLLVALAALGYGLYAALSGGGDTPPPITTQEPKKEPEPQKPPPVVERTVDPVVQTQNPTRTQVEQVAPSGEDYGQGLRGTLVNVAGQAVADSVCELYAGSTPKDLMSQMLAMQRGIVPQPLATTKSDEHGAFKLGLKDIPEGKVYELHVHGKSHAEYSQGNITLFGGRFWDVGQIKLTAGLVVQGHVVAEQGGQPIAGATVELTNVTQGFGFNTVPHGPGASTTTDAAGGYRFENAAPGQATIVAYAQGFARQEKTPALIRAEAENTFDFSLAPGMSIRGVIIDADGAPVGRASYQCLSLAPKNPISVQGGPDSSGRFEILGVVEGPYQIIVNAPGYSRKNAQPVMAGETDRQIVLEKQGSVKVKVVAKNGRLIDRFICTPKSWINNTPGNLFDHEVMRVNPRDLEGGAVTLGGFNPGTYVVQIDAVGYAMTFSQPFDITVGGADPEVTVQMLEGGSLSGTVVGLNGAPIAGVSVQTQNNDWEDNAIMGMFGAMIPVKISLMNIKTKDNGAFRLDKLTPGTYQLIFQHPDYTTTSVRDVQIVEGQHTDVPQVIMVPGTVISGSVLVDGVPSPQVKVQMSTAPDPNRKDGRGMFTSDTVTDEHGRFTFPKRVPPGRYQATAGRQGNPFLMVVDYNQTKQEFEIVTGQPVLNLDFAIRSQ